MVALVALFVGCSVASAWAQGRPFVIKWHASDIQNLKIPIYGKYKLKIIQPSGYVEERDIDGEIYDELKPFTGDYTIMAGPEGVERICMSDVESDTEHFTEVVDFGTVKWKSMNNAFYGCDGLKFKEGIQPPDLSQVTDMSGMFAFCTSFNQSFISNWDVSNVTNMRDMFRGCSAFNQPLNWNVSKVTDMREMFNGCGAFNQELAWDVSNVTDMTRMFAACSNFNKPLKWNVSKVHYMDQMFHNCQKFNQSLNDWQVGNVERMFNMFGYCRAFNQPLDKWDVRNVKDMRLIFQECSSFNQSLGGWKIKTVVDHLNNTAMDIANYSATLVGWAAWAEEGDVRDLHFGNNVNGLIYNAKGAAARKKLIARGWTFENDKERSLSFNTETLPLIPNEKGELTITVIGLNGTPKVTIEGESGVIEILSNDGHDVTMKALKPGSVKVKAKLEDCEAECTVTVKAVKVGSIEVKPTMQYLKVNETVTLQATVYPDNAMEKGVTWRSSNSQVATVDQNGLVTAKGLGKCYIFAKAKEAGSNIEDYCVVRIQGIKSVKIKNAIPSLKVHEKHTFTAEVDDESWTLSRTVTWKCNNTELATIDENSGEFTALAPGKVTVTATSKDDPTKMASCEVTLEGVKSISITESKTPLKVGDKSTFVATVEVAGEVATTVKWSTSDDKVAQVDETTGEVTAVAFGTATITATSTADATKKATVDVAVEGVKRIAITESKTPLTVEEKSTFVATVDVVGDVATTVKWSTSDEKVAVVNETSGEVTAVAPGTATITATSTADDTKKATVDVTVAGVKSIAITESKTPLKVGDKSTFKATVDVVGEVATTVKWSTSDDKVAQVDEATGEVTARASGKATITATSTADETKKAAIELIVKGLFAVTLTQPEHGNIEIEGYTTKQLQKVLEGTELKVKATPTSQGYKLKELKAGEVDIKSTMKFTVKADTNITARFEKETPAEDALFANVDVAPNPFSTELRIENPEGIEGYYELLTAAGVAVRSGALDAHKVILNTEALPAGVYFLHIRQGELTNTHKTVKVVKY